MTTIKDIAEHAQVSICTVSRYLNKNIKVKESTESRIKSAIKELKYIPNTVAKSLKTSSTKNIAVILPKINHLYYSEITSGISQVLEQYDYNLFIYEVEGSNKKEKDILTTMLENMMAGVIFIGLSYDMSFRSNLKILLDYNVPIVFVNRSIEFDEFPLVYPDYKLAGELVAEHLFTKGRRKIAIINRDFQNRDLYQHITGFINRFEEYGVSIDQGNFIINQSNFDITDNIIEIIRKKEIDGIFVTNELVAVGLIKALAKSNIKIPEEIAVVGFGNTLLGEIVTPELTCVDLQNYTMGVKSAEIILSQINEKDYENVNVLQPFIVERETT